MSLCNLKNCECPWVNKKYCTSISKEKNLPDCMIHSALNKAQSQYILKSYGL